MFRAAEEKDSQALVSLWEVVFGDEEAFVRECLWQFAGAGNVYLSAENGNIEAMLLSVPCHMGTLSGVYFYALATLPQRRGLGIMSRLMRYAEEKAAQNGAAFAALIPAGISLFDFYRVRGYTQSVSLRVLQKNFTAADTKVGNDIREETLSVASLRALRDRYLQVPTVMFPAKQQELIVRDLALLGGHLWVGHGGYAVSIMRGERLFLPELAALTENDAAAIVGTVQRALSPRGHVTISLPAGSPLWRGQGNLWDTALIRPLSSLWGTNAGVYLRFALDDTRDFFEMYEKV